MHSEPARDLFTYPNAPGHRGIDTSILAAEKIAPALPRLQRKVLEVIEAAGERGATGDEIAARLDMERFAVRPRTSELRAARKIEDSGLRRPSQSGIASIVWVAAKEEANG